MVTTQCTSSGRDITASPALSYTLIAIIMMVSAQCLLIQFCKGDKFLPSCLRLIIYIFSLFAGVLIVALIIALGVTYYSSEIPANCQSVHGSIATTFGVGIGFVVMLTVSALTCCSLYIGKVKIVRKSVPRQLVACC